MKINSKFYIYRDSKKEFRWVVKHRNGKKLFQSSEGYKRKSTMQRILRNAMYDLATSNYAIVDTTEKSGKQKK